MAINQAQREKLIQIQTESVKRGITWADVETLFATVSETEQQAFIDALLQSEKPIIKRKLDEYFRPKAAAQLDAILAKDVDFGVLLERLVK